MKRGTSSESDGRRRAFHVLDLSAQSVLCLLYPLALNQGKVAAEVGRWDVRSHPEWAFRESLEGEGCLQDVMTGPKLSVCLRPEKTNGNVHLG